MNCVCGHPPHCHAGGYQCGTVTVSGPAIRDGASAHIQHAGRNTARCDCPQYQAAT